MFRGPHLMEIRTRRRGPHGRSSRAAFGPRAAGCRPLQYTIAQSRRARLNGRAELIKELKHKTALALRVDKEAYVRGICEGVEHHLWSSDSHPAYRGICTLHSSKPIPWCTEVEAERGGLLREESEVKTCWLSLSGCTMLIHQLSSWMLEVLQSQLLTLQSTVVHLCLWKHRLC